MTALLCRSQRISNYAHDDRSPHFLFSGSLVPAMRPLTIMCWGPIVLLYDNLNVKMPRFS